MKKYVYLMLDEENNVVAIYDRKDLADKLLSPISTQVGKALTIKKQQINPDLKVVGI